MYLQCYRPHCTGECMYCLSLTHLNKAISIPYILIQSSPKAKFQPRCIQYLCCADQLRKNGTLVIQGTSFKYVELTEFWLSNEEFHFMIMLSKFVRQKSRSRLIINDEMDILTMCPRLYNPPSCWKSKKRTGFSQRGIRASSFVLCLLPSPLEATIGYGPGSCAEPVFNTDAYTTGDHLKTHHWY